MIHWSAGRARNLTDTLIGPAIAATVLMLFLMGCQPQASGPNGTEEPSEGEMRSPLEVVNLRMQAYNDHDLDTFLSTYSKDVEIFTYPDKSLGKGKKHIKSLFEEMFQDSTLQVEIHHQISKDGYVINHETVVSGETETEYVSIYEVRKGLIRSVRFVRD